MKLILTDHINYNTNLSVRIHLSEIGRFHVAIIVTCSRLLEQHACRLTCSWLKILNLAVGVSRSHGISQRPAPSGVKWNDHVGVVPSVSGRR